MAPAAPGSGSHRQIADPVGCQASKEEALQETEFKVALPSDKRIFAEIDPCSIGAHAVLIWATNFN